MELIGFLVYLLTKFAAYSGWCYLGLRWFDPSREGKARGSLFYGFLRLLMGVFFGMGVFLAALTMNNAVKNSMLTYLVVYVPVRIVEWSLMLLILRRQGAVRQYVRWVAGGVVLSCLADIPLGIMEGGVVPVGRPFCKGFSPLRPTAVGRA
ncbi:MAG TPA: hypothetical protein VHP35_06675, partial [Terriglobia bacterium]|jgi:hypothetical protein|nr:hypothetical protein [Terriglobia bacterium]